jgi:hypothetical protein
MSAWWHAFLLLHPPSNADVLLQPCICQPPSSVGPAVDSCGQHASRQIRGNTACSKKHGMSLASPAFCCCRLHVSPFEGKYTAQLEVLASYVEANHAWLPQLVWLDTAMQHFSTWDGSYVGSKPPYACKPLDAWYKGEPSVVAGGRYNIQAAPFVPRLARAHLRTWNASVPLWDVHKPGECTHWCSPTAYHVWLYLLNQEMRQAGIGREVAVGSRHTTRL